MYYEDTVRWVFIGPYQMGDHVCDLEGSERAYPSTLPEAVKTKLVRDLGGVHGVLQQE